jgi:hypothetical protein
MNIYKKRDKVNNIKIFCKKNYKIIIIIIFLLRQSIVPKMFIINTLLYVGHSLES